ncbi:MAG: 3-dehydroquinate synthase [Desulfobacteraceae bacterium]
MDSEILQTRKDTRTEYKLSDNWKKALFDFLTVQFSNEPSDNVVILSDTNVWDHYGVEIESLLHRMDKNILPLLLKPGEGSKDFRNLSDCIEQLIQHQIQRRDLLICMGGGVCCDFGGLLALLYMRGMHYILIPTTLMALIDASIGGKVGANWSMRKNLLGGFYHPLLVIMAPGFLQTLPEKHFKNALAEAVKIAIITHDIGLLDILEKEYNRLLNLDRDLIKKLIEFCLKWKLELLKSDPYEYDLNRVLNLGHAIAHSLEGVYLAEDDIKLLHGEAVSIGLAACIRFSYKNGYCTKERASRLLRILQNLDLPIEPLNGREHKALINNLVSRIPEHRGGAFRLVIPVADQGVDIVASINTEALVECIFKIPELGI